MVIEPTAVDRFFFRVRCHRYDDTAVLEIRLTSGFPLIVFKLDTPGSLEIHCFVHPLTGDFFHRSRSGGPRLRASARRVSDLAFFGTGMV